jgi:hypothetical protein
MSPVSSAIGMNCIGATVPKVRVLPAQERFHAGDAAADNVALGLIVQPELLALERVPQTRFQRQPLERIGVSASPNRTGSCSCPSSFA